MLQCTMRTHERTVLYAYAQSLQTTQHSPTRIMSAATQKYCNTGAADATKVMLIAFTCRLSVFAN
jgi:hypothetical protein